MEQELWTNGFSAIGALISVLVGTDYKLCTKRDYLAICFLSVLAGIVAADTILTSKTVATTTFVGACVGFFMDDIYLNLKAATPNFIKSIIETILDGLQEKIKKAFGKKEDGK